MKKLTVLLTFIFAVNAFAQKDSKPTEKDKSPGAATVIKSAAPLDLAKMALAAHGGDKFKNMKTLVVRGTADVSGSPSTTFPATFATIYAGDKYRLEITNPLQPFKQIYDGQETYSSINNFTLPPINRLGLPLLPKIEDKGFAVSALPDLKKKKTGFRITSPEGFYTDFFVDDKTGEVKGYEASYEINGRAVTTAVEIDKLREVEGVKIPEKYAQRLETGSFTVYVAFKAKEITVNSTIPDDIFVMK